MKLSEVGKLLTLAAAFDQRTIGQADAAAWHSILGVLDFDDAMDAVREHYATSRERIMPVDVRRGVHRLRSARLAPQPDPLPAADPDDPEAYAIALRAARRALADRPAALRALEGGAS